MLVPGSFIAEGRYRKENAGEGSAVASASNPGVAGRADAVSFDPEAVRAFEHAGWQKAAGEYRATFAAATAEFVEALLDGGRVADGAALLDLCCGPGIVAAAAAKHGAAVCGVDFSPAMLAEARAANPGIRFEQGDAEALPFADGSLDAVVSNFGIHHVPRPARALAEAARVLRPGGRLAFTTWAAPQDNIAWRLLFDAIRLHGNMDAARAPPSGGGLGQPEIVRRLLREAGFAGVSVTIVGREWRLSQPAGLIAALRRGTVRTAALIEAQSPAALVAIIDEIARQAAVYQRDGSYFIPVAALLGYGTKAE
jgi:SAM-dependent methyltransferase